MIDIIEETGVIDGITLKKTKKGKDMYVVSISERDYYAFDFVPAFKLIDEKRVEIGREITAKYVFSEPYMYKGKETKSRHLKNLVEVEIEEKPKPVVVPEVEHINVNEEPKKEPIKPVEPVKKNLCGATSLQQLYIIRQSSLKAAIEFLGNNTIIGNNTDNNTDEVLNLAEKMEKWVLR